MRGVPESAIKERLFTPLPYDSRKFSEQGRLAKVCPHICETLLDWPT